MKSLLLSIASLAVFPLAASAQRGAPSSGPGTAPSTAPVRASTVAASNAPDAGPPGPGWKAIVAGRPVFITADSLSKIAKDSFRYVIFRRLGDAESTETAEVRCADRTRRTVRLETRGKYIVPDKSGKHRKVQSTPNAAFENPYPGGAADVILQRVCDMGHTKFPSAKRR